MNKTIIVSNRLPVELEIYKDRIKFNPSVGGLTTGMSSVFPKGDNLWVGWLGVSEEEMPTDDLKDEITEEVIRRNFVSIGLSEKEIEDYYYGYSNKIIWPLFHYFTEFAQFNQLLWKGYKKVNQKFAQEILNYANDSDTIWIHDYHLLLLPKLLKKRKPKLNIGFFLHIPFPAFEVFRLLPTREEILKSLLSNDLIGFHTNDYQQHFLECVEKLIPSEIDGNEITYDNHKTIVKVYPMGIDAEKFKKEAIHQNNKELKEHSLRHELEEYARKNHNLKYILSIDRMDYTKGIVDRLKAFDFFLDENPEYIEKVKLLMLAVPSRTNVRQYQLLKKEIDEVVGRINSKYATVSWTPVLYMYRSLPFENLVELYVASDIALITPIRDGMNLVAKEYVMSRPKQDGVLILSEMAGAAEELTEALIINPVSYEGISNAIKAAIEMSKEEQIFRISRMQKKVENTDVQQWAENFLTDLEYFKNKNSEHLSAFEKLEQIRADYHSSKNRLILLDYDGTLVGFEQKPKYAVPDTDLLDLLKEFQQSPKNDIYIISGRDKDSLGNWFKELSINLVSEHGAFFRSTNKEWTDTINHDLSWKSVVQELLEKFTKKVPKSLIEEKTYSVAWHYRMANPEIGKQNAEKLLRMLKYLSYDFNLRVLNGNKVVEIMEKSVNKGEAVKSILNQQLYDFILCIGDDHTDEFMFKQLPKSAHTIKVGIGDSAASLRLDNFKKTRLFLWQLLQSSTKNLKEKNQDKTLQIEDI